jgi:hypothetical protein
VRKNGRGGDRGAGAALLLLALVVGAGGCRAGGAGNQRSATSPPVTGSNGEFCEAARQSLGRLGSVAEQGRPADPSAAAAVYRELATFLEAAARIGPEQIQADAAAAASVMTEYSDALQRAGSEPTGIPAEMSAKLQSEQFVAGITRVADYTRATCGLAD